MAGNINETLNFIASIGAEALKEKGTNIYNEQKIKKELMVFTDKESMHFEKIDRNCEFDFENLRTYIIENLIGDFRQALYGDNNKRRQLKESMLECLYSHVQADSFEKKQYVEAIFLNAYKIIERYYETQMIKAEDMYLANKVVDAVHKDIQQSLAGSIPSESISSPKICQPQISMVQYGDKSQQIGQVSNLTIIND